MTRIVHPTRLPHLRDRMLDELAHDQAPPEARTAAINALRGELYLASADMTALAVSAGRALDTTRWVAEDRISPLGLMVADGGFGMIRTHETPGTDSGGVDLPVEAVSWGPGPAVNGVPVLLLVTWVSRDRLADAFTRQARQVAGPLQDQAVIAAEPDTRAASLEGAPALVPAWWQGLRAEAEPRPVADLPPRVATVARTLWAAWQLMRQPTIAEPRPGPVDKAVARSYARAGRPPPAVTIVELRRLYQPRDGDAATGDGRTYRHRWVVRGHWRDQAHGPGRAQRRRIFVPAHVKGPDGAPMLHRERVNVWDR